MGSEQYCLRWTNHQTSVLGVFRQLQEAGSLVDVTLASAEGLSLRAHKVVLSACSSYFRSLFLDHPTRHPIVILKDVSFEELRTLVDFMYRGEVNVETCRLSALLKTAESLQVKGLAEMKGGGEASPNRPPASPAQGPSPQSPSAPASPRPLQQPPPLHPADEEDSISSDHSQPPLDPTPGPSSLPPVQDAPLSLKKEVVDWDRSDEKSCSTAGQSSSSDYSHPPRDPGEGMSWGGVLARHVLGLDALRGTTTPPSMPSHASSAAAAAAAAAAQHLVAPPPGALCKFCGKTFADVGSLVGHLPAHTGDRPFKCEFCGKAFKLRHHMKDHCRVHTGERPFRCALCGKTFSRSTILKAHEKTHYPKYMRKYLESPGPDVDPPPPLPYDLSVSESFCLPRPPYDHPLPPPSPLYLPRSPPSP